MNTFKHVFWNRFDDEVITELLKIKWWDWSKEKITRNIHAIVGSVLAERMRELNFEFL